MTTVGKLMRHVERRAVECARDQEELLRLRERDQSVAPHIGRLVALLRPTPEYQEAVTADPPRDVLAVVADVLERLMRQEDEWQRASVIPLPGANGDGET